tara:strand:- start:2626 stop:2829 length:204 start_codon:yes stop_codon:yes gene_type:complete
MNKEDVIKMLNSHKTHYKSWADMAETIGVSTSFLSQISTGKKDPCGKVLEFIGLEKTISYNFIKVTT